MTTRPPNCDGNGWSRITMPFPTLTRDGVARSFKIIELTAEPRTEYEQSRIRQHQRLAVRRHLGLHSQHPIHPVSREISKGCLVCVVAIADQERVPEEHVVPDLH